MLAELPTFADESPARNYLAFSQQLHQASRPVLQGLGKMGGLDCAGSAVEVFYSTGQFEGAIPTLNPSRTP